MRLSRLGFSVFDMQQRSVPAWPECGAPLGSRMSCGEHRGAPNPAHKTRLPSSKWMPQPCHCHPRDGTLGIRTTAMAARRHLESAFIDMFAPAHTRNSPDVEFVHGKFIPMNQVQIRWYTCAQIFGPLRPVRRIYTGVKLLAAADSAPGTHPTT